MTTVVWPPSSALAEAAPAEMRRQRRATGIGWIPELPDDWRVLPAKRLFRNVSVKNRPAEQLLSVLQDGGVVPRSEMDQRVVMPMGELSGFKLVRRGQFVISLRSFQGGIEFSRYEGLVSPAYTVLQPTAFVRPQYYRILLKSSRFVEALGSAVTGIRDGKNIDYESFGRIPLPVPPADDQDAIVIFLDRKLEEIDRFIAAKRRMIELLEEQKTAMIDRAVTKGLNPNAKTRPSGFSWQGEIPEHWDTHPLKRFCRVTDCKHLTVSFVPQGVPVASIRECRGLAVDLSEAKRTTRAEYAQLIDGDRRPTVGDIIYTRNASVGMAARVETTATFCMGQDVCLIRSRACDTGFLVRQLRSNHVLKQLDRVMIGSTFRRINVADVKSLTLIVPPKVEQEQIAARVIGLEAKAADATRSIEREIELMTEYRTALISDAVTGEIDLSATVPVTSAVAQPTATAESTKSGRTANIHFKRSVFAAEIIHRLHQEPTFGHVKCEKLIFLCEKRCGVETGSTYRRKAAGPYDNRALRSIDSQIAKRQWYGAEKVDKRYRYVPLEKAGGHGMYFRRYFADVEAEFSQIIDTFRTWDTERCEIVATLYSAWEDLLAEGKEATDDQIVEQVLEHWHPAKQRIAEERWRRAIGWMKKNGFVPARDR